MLYSLYIARVRRKKYGQTLEAHQLQRNNRTQHNNKNKENNITIYSRILHEKNTLLEDSVFGTQKDKSTQEYIYFLFSDWHANVLMNNNSVAVLRKKRE